MSWKSCVTATFATLLVTAVLGCDDDPSGLIPDPPLNGEYDYTFDVSNGETGEAEVACAGQGMITITQQTGSTFTAETAEDGEVTCVIFGFDISEASGVVELDGTLDGDNVTFEFPLLADLELCDATGETSGDDPVTSISGTATCELDPTEFGFEGDLITLNGTWEAQRTDN